MLEQDHGPGFQLLSYASRRKGSYVVDLGGMGAGGSEAGGPVERASKGGGWYAGADPYALDGPGGMFAAEGGIEYPGWYELVLRRVLRSLGVPRSSRSCHPPGDPGSMGAGSLRRRGDVGRGGSDAGPTVRE